MDTMRRRSERTLPMRDIGMCQSYSSVPRTYIRAADELEPLSSGGRLASFPSLGPGTCCRAQSPLDQLRWSTTRLPQSTTIPPFPPPKPLPSELPKSLRPSKLPLKNLDELSPLGAEKPAPGSGLLGKCVLCLLLNAVFVLALFLAFLIGHFLAEAHLPFMNKTNNSASSASASTGASPSNAITSRPPSAVSPLSSTLDSREQEFRKSVERSRQRVSSVGEVYPPQLNSDPDPWEDSEDMAFPLNPVQLGNGPVMHRSVDTPAPDVPLHPLPRTVLPRHYNVNLDLTEFYGVVEPPQVRGNLSILLEAFGNATDEELVFHAGANIFIQRIQLYQQTELGKQLVEIRSVKRHNERELVRLVLGHRMRAGWYWLDMEFRTRVCQSDSVQGAHCFPSPATSTSTPRHQSLIAGFATKFEPNFGRTFLPGWDEPRYRSTFNVTVRHFSDATILTNTAPLPFSSSLLPTSTSVPSIRLSRFKTTPPMPLYLLAFATGPFTPLEVRTSRDNLPLTVWAAPQDMLTAHFVANFSPTIFDRLQDDFGVKYPLSKMDIFLTPKFSVGGMENWGLIVLHTDTVRLTTTDGTLPLTIDTSSSKEERQREEQQQSLMGVDRLSEQYRVEKAITHELVHQWFGNLVGIWDWEELWLSEGFASYFVFDFLNAANHPHLTEHEYYLRLIELVQRQSADGRSALVRPLRSARQLDKLFDGVQLYTKGAVMVKMLKDLVGPAEFRAGIARFLRQNSFQSVDRRAVWDAFPTHADHGVDPVRLKEAMEPWLVNRGVPEMEVTRNYGDQSIRLEQRQAEQNRHLVFLDDEAMHRMRMAMEEEHPQKKKMIKWKKNNSRRRRRRRRRDVETETAEKDIGGILEWMMTEEGGERKDRTKTTKMTKNESEMEGGGSKSGTKLAKDRGTQGQRGRQGQDRKGHRWREKKIGGGGRKQGQRRAKNQGATGKKQQGMAGRAPMPVFSSWNPKRTGKNQQKSEKDEPVRFLYEAEEEPEDPKRRHSRERTHRERLGPLWPIPFSYAFGSVRSSRGQTVRQFWLLNDTIRFVDVGLDRANYLLANPHWMYAYRVNYDVQNWRMLIAELHKNHQEIPAMSRMQLIVDGETFLRQSSNPQLFVQLLSYLAVEDDLGVLLVGLDALHSLLELFGASDVFGTLVVHFLPVLRQLDRQLALTASPGTDPELAALWLLNPLRLAKLYQLRCAANLETCAEGRQVRKWLAFPTALAADNHQQLAALCQHLFAHAGPSEVSLLSGLLKQPQHQSGGQAFAALIRQLSSSCVQDEALVRQAVAEILKTRNVIVYASALNTGYTVHYNRKFRELFWTGLAQQLNIHERQILFAVNTGKSDRMSRILLHSIRSLGELNLVERVVLHQWPNSLRIEMDYLRRKFAWTEREASEKIRKHLVQISAVQGS